MKAVLSTALVFTAHAFCAAWTAPRPPSLMGRWKVDVTFSDESRHSLRFDARAAGKGSLLLVGPRSSLAEPATPSAAEWTQGAKGVVTFSGAVEFPIGNVGRDRGMLVFKGAFEAENLVSGEAAFYPAGRDPKDPQAVPSRKGKFKAARVAASDPTR